MSAFKTALDAMSEINAKRDARILDIQATHVAALKASRSLERPARTVAKREATSHCLVGIELAYRDASDARALIASLFRA